MADKTYPRLPRPDKLGNYWLGSKSTPAGPAVFPTKELCKDGVRATGTWIAFLGTALGFVYMGPELKRFASPEDALVAINEAVANQVASGKY